MSNKYKLIKTEGKWKKKNQGSWGMRAKPKQRDRNKAEYSFYRGNMTQPQKVPWGQIQTVSSECHLCVYTFWGNPWGLHYFHRTWLICFLLSFSQQWGSPEVSPWVTSHSFNTEADLGIHLFCFKSGIKEICKTMSFFTKFCFVLDNIVIFYKMLTCNLFIFK